MMGDVTRLDVRRWIRGRGRTDGGIRWRLRDIPMGLDVAIIHCPWCAEEL